MAQQRIHILNTHIDNLSMQETLSLVDSKISAHESLHHTVVNAGKIIAMQDDEVLRKSVNEADLINADGQAVIWASKLLGQPLKERVAGIDLFENLIDLAHQKKHSIYLLGAKDEIVNKLVHIIEKNMERKLLQATEMAILQLMKKQKLLPILSAAKPICFLLP